MRRVGEFAHRKAGIRASRKLARFRVEAPVKETEEEFRDTLLRAFESVRGMVIEDVYPVSSDRDEVRH